VILATCQETVYLNCLFKLSICICKYAFSGMTPTCNKQLHTNHVPDSMSRQHWLAGEVKLGANVKCSYLSRCDICVTFGWYLGDIWMIFGGYLCDICLGEQKAVDFEIGAKGWHLKFNLEWTEGRKCQKRVKSKVTEIFAAMLDNCFVTNGGRGQNLFWNFLGHSVGGWGSGVQNFWVKIQCNVIWHIWPF